VAGRADHIASVVSSATDSSVLGIGKAGPKSQPNRAVVACDHCEHRWCLADEYQCVAVIHAAKYLHDWNSQRVGKYSTDHGGTGRHPTDATASSGSSISATCAGPWRTSNCAWASRPENHRYARVAVRTKHGHICARGIDDADRQRTDSSSTSTTTTAASTTTSAATANGSTGNRRSDRAVSGSCYHRRHRNSNRPASATSAATTTAATTTATATSAAATTTTANAS